MKRLPFILALSAVLVFPVLAVNATPLPPAEWAGSYVGPGSIVASFALLGGNGDASATFVDNGALICEDTNGDGIYDKGNGGTCIRFDRMQNGWSYQDSILVVDGLSYTDVAFQVCVDMNADNLCGSGIFQNGLVGSGSCPDLILFSHNSFNGGYANPMYVDQYHIEGQWRSCGGNGFPGYIVILCAGEHQTQGDMDGHQHLATIGQVYTTWGGSSAYGDYCGAPTAVKAYQVYG